MREQQEYVVLTGSPVPSPAQGPPTRPLLPQDPTQIGPYRLQARLGAGGMGTVYLGVDAQSRTAAVKVVRSDHAGDDTFRERFRREVAAAARVRSRFTADLIAADVDAAEPWLATQYVPGPTLTRAVSDQGALAEPAVMELIAGIAEALCAIHGVGLVHRDLKPSNVLLGPDGPCVIDLGVVRTSEATTLTTTGLQVGTPTFMAPEQARGDSVTPAADIWALGGLVYFAATGLRLFGDGQPSAILYRVVHTEPDLVRCPPRLRPFVMACLAKDPAARPSAAAILAAVRPGGTPPRPAPATQVPAPMTGAAVAPVPGVPLAPPLVSPQPELTGTFTHLAATGLHTPVLPEAAPEPATKPVRDRSARVRLAALVGAVVLVGSGLGTALAMAGDRAEAPPAAVITSAPPSASPTPSPSPTPSASPTPTPSATPVAAAPPPPPPPPEPRLFTAGTAAIAGQPAVGQTLTVTSTGVWSPAPDPELTTCVWYRNSNQLTTDGSCSYIVGPGDVGSVLAATLVAGAPDHVPVEVPAPRTGTVVRGTFAIAVPVVAGKKVVGQPLTCTAPGLEKYPAATVKYTWFRGIPNGSAVFGSNSSKATVPKEAVGHSIKCEILVKQPGYDDLTSRSGKFGLITAS